MTGSVVVALPLLLGASGCAVFSADSAADAVAGDGELRIAAGFYPLEFVADRVAGDRATVDNLTVPGQEPHDLELTVQETAAIARADLVVYVDGFQPAVDAAVETSAVGRVLDASEFAHLRTDSGERDPHFWLDPVQLDGLVESMAEQLTALDPDGAADYARNAGDLRADLDELDAAYDQGLSGCERSTVVVSHDAFAYLGRYGLEFEPIAGLSPDAEPTPSDLARLHELIEAEGITTVFGERLAPPELVETLAEDAGVTTDVLDPIEGLSDETDGEDYVTLMQANLDALRTANGCRA
jgi:zinc transport system substrate-binding protein